MNQLSIYYTLLILLPAWVYSQNTTLVFNDSTPKVHIRKCRCGPSEALLNGTCVAVEQTLVPFWDFSLEDIVQTQVSSQIVSIDAIENCSNGSSKLTINYFVIYEDGTLDNLDFSDDPMYTDYCVEFNVVGERVFPYAEVCSETAKVPICCAPGHGEACLQKLNFPLPVQRPVPSDNVTLLATEISCGPATIMAEEFVMSPYEYGAALVGYPPAKSLQWFDVYMSQPAYYGITDYCLIPKDDGSYLARFCIPDPKIAHDQQCNNVTCIRKCCPTGMIYDWTYLSCVPHNSSLKFKFYDSDMQEADMLDGFTVVYGMPICDEFFQSQLKLADDTNDTVVVTDGRVTLDRRPRTDASRFCIDGVIDDFQDGDSVRRTAALACFVPLKDQCQWRFVVGSTMLGVSCVFYLATLLVYVTVPALRKKIVGKCLISQVSALLVSYIILIFLQNSRSYLTLSCNLPGTIEHIVALAAFFWLNVMCFDMWRNLKSMRIASAKTGSSNKRFLMYCLYGWGVPVVISLIRLIIDSLPEEMASSWLVRANLGKTHCFFTSQHSPAKWVYLYLPVLIILLINIGFFVHVAVILVKAQRENRKRLQGANSGKTGKNFNAKKARARLYLKLFLVMGLSWTMEIVMWIAVPENDCYFWALDTVNMFQGVFIFIIFVCKESTLRKVKEHFGWGQRRSNNINLDW